MLRSRPKPNHEKLRAFTNQNFLIMAIEHLYIARVTDGLILVASMEHSGPATNSMENFKTQVN